MHYALCFVQIFKLITPLISSSRTFKKFFNQIKSAGFFTGNKELFQLKQHLRSSEDKETKKYQKKNFT